jgi:hypothetical protein
LIGPLDLAERHGAQHRADDGNQQPDVAENGQWNAEHDTGD